MVFIKILKPVVLPQMIFFPLACVIVLEFQILRIHMLIISIFYTIWGCLQGIRRSISLSLIITFDMNLQGQCRQYKLLFQAFRFF